MWVLAHLTCKLSLSLQMTICLKYFMGHTYIQKLVVYLKCRFNRASSILSGRPPRITMYLIIQKTKTLLRVKLDTDSNYDRIIGINWGYLGKQESMANLITRCFERIFNYWFQIFISNHISVSLTCITVNLYKMYCFIISY